MLIPRIGRDLERAGVGQRHRPGGHDAQPEGFGGGDGRLPQSGDVPGELGQAAQGRLFASTTERCISQLNRPAGSCPMSLSACPVSPRVARSTIWNSSSTPAATSREWMAERMTVSIR